MEFTKNENYYLGTPNIDRLIIRVVPSANVLSGLMNGELDLIGFGSVLTDDWETAKSQDNLVTESVPTTSYTTLIFNTQKMCIRDRSFYREKGFMISLDTREP